MLHRLSASLTVVLAVAVWADEPTAPAPPPPNVLLVTLDTTRADRLGCYGGESGLTPNLDRLAGGGVRFARALSPTPLTLPSHASIMTGRTPRRHGARDNGMALDGRSALLAERLRDEGYATAAFVSAAVLDRHFGLARGFDHYDDGVRIGERSGFDYRERAASQTVDAAIDHLRRAGAPFFLWVHLFDPHLPYVPPAPWRSRFAGRPYDGEIAFADEQFGRLWQAAAKRSERLVVVVAGDHGESLGDHGEEDHGVFVYEATQRVPLIVAGDGLPRGKVVEGNVGLIDIAATVLELVGGAPLDDDGRSLLPQMRGEAVASADYELETLYPWYAYGWAPLRALVRGPLKYVEAPQPELYDLATDPGELKNLLPDPRARAFRAALRRLDPGETSRGGGLDPELRRRLAGLGYVGGTPTDGEKPTIDPKRGVVLLGELRAARAALQQGRAEDAVAALRRLLAENPTNVPALLSLGTAYLQLGQPKRTVQLAARAVELRPDDEASLFQLANALAAVDDEASRKLAEERYEQLLAASPRFADGYLNYAALLVSRRQFARAEALLAKARTNGVEDPEIEFEAGVLAAARGDLGSAEPRFLETLRLNPRHADALEFLGQLTYAQGRFGEAEVHYALALEVRPQAGLAKTLGSIRLHDLGDVDGAREAYRRALELSRPDDPDRTILLELIEELR